MSLVAMVVAGLGYLPPSAGALVQEAIDVAVILNALRARGGGLTRRAIAAVDAELARRFVTEHDSLRPGLDRSGRQPMDSGRTPAARRSPTCTRSIASSSTNWLPHEVAEGTLLYPVLDRVLGGAETTATMSRAHAEIVRLIRRLGRVLEAIDAEQPDDGDVRELRRLLYGLHAILRLHFAQEEEGYFSLLDAPETVRGLHPDGATTDRGSEDEGRFDHSASPPRWLLAGLRRRWPARRRPRRAGCPSSSTPTPVSTMRLPCSIWRPRPRSTCAQLP